MNEAWKNLIEGQNCLEDVSEKSSEEPIETPQVEQVSKKNRWIGKGFVVCTLPAIDADYDVLGIVVGSVVHAYENISDFGSLVKDFYRGETDSYGDFLERVHIEAEQQMRLKAIELGADGCLGVTFTTNDIMGEIVEFCSVGTAIKFR